ncbi:FMN-binding glutamate synthase family protein [Desulfitobacterium sp.]|uniref:FMN-binding glutamate synthase family protein n=1 Tax=Desulfitobacterium sp. TaxID=49981 RepID=UPI002B51B33E|nr:FMN-binding glutamate synthase family protein [Desulfitobacterium sp.]HVJ50423.1 FMN-binding glutamate synthase family protein [Desulfitobacterium sp.]
MQIIINKPVTLLLILIIFFILVLIVVLLLAKPLTRYIIKMASNDFSKKLLSDKYTQNLAELIPSLQRFSVLNLIETGLRAHQGKVITRPLGTPKHFPGFEKLLFVPPLMAKLSLHESTKINMRVTLGPKATKPLTLEIPLMISAMAYGLALSDEAKIALARASKTLQTAICSGEGPLLPEERQEAGNYILQISRWSWGGRTSQQIASANMLEVQMGQGADMGSVRVEATELEGRAQQLGGLAPGEPAISLPAPPGINAPEDWPKFMEDLRQKANGIPIALKLMATGRIEEDLAFAVDLGFDAVVIDGSQGGSHATTPIKQDDFGIPTLNALIRTVEYLKNQPISIIISGGFFTPGNCLKALALGADAIFLATVPLFALVHDQAEKVTPWEPPTTLVYYDSPSKSKLDIALATTSVTNTLQAMALEMEEGMRALGKKSLKELSPDDLVALDTYTAEVTGVKRIY